MKHIFQGAIGAFWILFLFLWLVLFLVLLSFN